MNSGDKPNNFGHLFGALVRRYRESLGITAGELALRAFGDEAKRSRISELENGRVSRPHAKTISRLAETLAIPNDVIEDIRKESDLRPVNTLPKAVSTTPLLSMSLDEYEQRIADKIKVAEEKLETAHSAEKAQLLIHIEQLKKRAADPEAELAKAQATIAELSTKLDRLNNINDPKQITAAKTAMQDEDYTLARELLEEQRAKAVLQKQDADQSLAEIEYELGKIAETEIRWHDAAAHYIRAAELHGSAMNIQKAQFWAQQSGDLRTAAYWGEKLIPAVIRDEGEGSIHHATCLNNLANLYRAQGKYAQAEPLYAQAIKIDKKTIGEEHPDYATHVNSLAELYRAQGKYDQAEPLNLQAIEIDKKTIGEQHPEYAIRLNNLAALYDAQGKYDQAEPLLVQAIEIDKKTIGEEHPNYATHLNNLAGLYRAKGKHDQAEPLYLQAIDIAMAALGADHPKTKLYKKNYQTFLQSKP